MCLRPSSMVLPAKIRRAGNQQRLDEAVCPELILQMNCYEVLQRWESKKLQRLLMNDRPLMADIRRHGLQVVATLRNDRMPVSLIPVRSYVLENDAELLADAWKGFPGHLIQTVTDGGLTISIAIKRVGIPWIKLDC